MRALALFLTSAMVAMVLVPVSSAQTRTMVIHLPEAPIESMGQLGDGVTRLASYLEAASAGLTLEVKAFRKTDDALSYIGTNGSDIALIVSDAAFLADLPAGFTVTPSFRFVRAGRETRRKLVVVKSDGSFESLADLRGRSITVAQSSGPGSSRYLAGAVFGEEIDPGDWFGSIQHETDDFSATAAVVYGRTEAALVSEDNPLLVSHLGKGLREVYTSRPVSMSVVSIRRQALSTSQVAALEDALVRLEHDSSAAAILTVLKIDGFRRVVPGAVLADLTPPRPTDRALEIATPTLYTVGADGLPAPDPSIVPFFIGIELVEVPIPSELVDAVLEREKP